MYLGEATVIHPVFLCHERVSYRISVLVLLCFTITCTTPTLPITLYLSLSLNFCLTPYYTLQAVEERLQACECFGRLARERFRTVADHS